MFEKFLLTAFVVQPITPDASPYFLLAYICLYQNPKSDEEKKAELTPVVSRNMHKFQTVSTKRLHGKNVCHQREWQKI